jgi:hypothetical protein
MANILIQVLSALDHREYWSTPAALSGESFAIEDYQTQSKLEKREHSAKIRTRCQGCGPKFPKSIFSERPTRIDSIV